MAGVMLPPVPRYQPIDKRQVEINFNGTLATGAFLSVVAGPITYRFRIIQVKMIFTDDANNLVEHGWFISSNAGVSTTGFPSGDNIFSVESPATLFVGKHIVRIANTNVKIDEINRYIKLYTHNTCGTVYAFNCAIVIQEL